ncbi:MAG TPA: FtsX-like permease family protein, partial [Longimicrobiales bacterium]|nr:FtsX-like permease family protein [Longimicrobiales bacterium]
IYVPMAQAPGPWAQVAIRVRGEPTAFAPLLREVVARLDPDLPVLEVQSMPDLIHGRTSLYRFQSPPFIAVGLAALFLSLAGLYAVVSYLASLRVVEFGIRAALGAGRWELVRRAATSALWPVAAGIAVGVAAGLAMVRGFDRWLFQVDPWAPGPIGLSVGVMALSALASALLPARRASRVDLVSVLKGD